MKDKRFLLKIAGLIEIVYVLVMVFYYLFFNKFSDEVLAYLFMLIIGLFFGIVLFKESKRSIDELKQNKAKVVISSIWLFLEPVIPGILGFIFLSTLSDKKKSNLPVIKEDKKSVLTYVKSIILIVAFIIIMFVLPNFSFFSKIPTYLIYIFIFLLVLILNFKELKKDFIIFIKNIKVYFPFIIKRYLIMLGVMIIVALPIVYLNNGATSSNQTLINDMFVKIPFLTFLLSVIYAPIVEESIFRLSIKKFFNNKIAFVLVSGILFGTLHMIDKFTSFYDLLYIFQYSALGICLALAYYDSKNIFVSMSMHFIQNFLAAVLVLLVY
ncbi:MAG TPA: CPBP family intramembrane metalloprotease [Candidatus Aphodocola excrementigallinarum]|uniref:CPBP family intramembrane metalloprotease n=1 Tax=Candidatus Aphodocola excrementigallinarum TaxID=2840670 RepID=A0A9D1LHM3_9FIRM|nr:CPBP family intramembrane metalloprotease [Candidatus Aphodocola excrementigallinarum]